MEVDLVIETPKGEIIGVEIKTKEAPDQRDFSLGFAALKSLAPNAKCLCVYPGKTNRVYGDVLVMAYGGFFEYLKGV